MLKEIVRALGMDPEKILVNESLIEPNRSVLEPDGEVQLLSHRLKDFLLREVAANLQSEKHNT